MTRPSRRAIGTAMMTGGVLGIILSIAGVFVGEQLIGRVEDGVDNSLKLTAEALGAVSDSVDVTRRMVATVDETLTGLGDTLDTVSSSLDQASGAIGNTQDFVGTSLPDALEEVDATLGTLEGVAGSVDDALRVLSRAPFGPDYDPTKPFDQTIRDLSASIEPLPDELRTLSTDVDGLAESASTLSRQVSDLRTQLSSLHDQVGEVSVLLDRYAATAAGAEAVAARSHADLGGSMAAARWLLLLLGLVFAVGQIVPIWLGSTLRADGGDPRSLVDATRHT